MYKDLICPDFNTSLEDVLRDGARQMLQSAIENEVAEFLEKYSSNKGVKRNGYLPERFIQTGVGPLPIRKPRVRGGCRASKRSFRHSISEESQQIAWEKLLKPSLVRMQKGFLQRILFV